MRLRNAAYANQQISRASGYIIPDDQGYVTIGSLYAHRVLKAKLLTLGFVVV